MITWQIPEHWRDVRRHPRYGRFMSKPRAIGLSLMVVGGCAYGTAPDWLALLVGLLGLAATLFADFRTSGLRSRDGISASSSTARSC